MIHKVVTEIKYDAIPTGALETAGVGGGSSCAPSTTAHAAKWRVTREPDRAALQGLGPTEVSQFTALNLDEATALPSLSCFPKNEFPDKHPSLFFNQCGL